MADCDYNYDDNSPPPSPPPAEFVPDHLKHASLSDIFLYLRSRAGSGPPADDHSRQAQHQQQIMYVINRPDGTTLRHAIVSGAAATAPSRGHRHRASTAATPYHRPERHERWSNRGPSRSLAPHEDDDEGATEPVCLAKRLSPSDCLEDDGFYQRRFKRGRRRSPAPLHGDDKGATKVVCLAKMLSPSDRLEDDGFYQHFLENVTKEARKFGDLVKVVIPRPAPGVEGSGTASVVSGVGKVFLEYRHLGDAAWCRKWYGGGEPVAAAFFPQDRFDVGDYDYDG